MISLTQKFSPISIVYQSKVRRRERERKFQTSLPLLIRTIILLNILGFPRQVCGHCGEISAEGIHHTTWFQDETCPPTNIISAAAILYDRVDRHTVYPHSHAKIDHAGSLMPGLIRKQSGNFSSCCDLPSLRQLAGIRSVAIWHRFNCRNPSRAYPEKPGFWSFPAQPTHSPDKRLIGRILVIPNAVANQWMLFCDFHYFGDKCVRLPSRCVPWSLDKLPTLLHNIPNSFSFYIFRCFFGVRFKTFA